jgi:hypothetical protein
MRLLNWVKGFFTLVPAQDLRPDPHSGEGRYVRSFLVIRLFIGFIGVLLPFALVLIDHWWFQGYPYPRGSESIYYYSGMREVFTVSIGVIAFFMFAYKITERNLDNTLSFFAGVAGILIVLFPTAPPALIQKGFTKPTNPVPLDLTPLQKSLTEPTTHTIHQFTSGASFSSLDLRRSRSNPRRSARNATTTRSFRRLWRCTGAALPVFDPHHEDLKGPYWSSSSVRALAFRIRRLMDSEGPNGATLRRSTADRRPLSDPPATGSDTNSLHSTTKEADVHRYGRSQGRAVGPTEARP